MNQCTEDVLAVLQANMAGGVQARDVEAVRLALRCLAGHVTHPVEQRQTEALPPANTEGDIGPAISMVAGELGEVRAAMLDATAGVLRSRRVIPRVGF